MFSVGIFKPINFSISRKKVSSGLNKEIASPFAPALPVLPIGVHSLQEYLVIQNLRHAVIMGYLNHEQQYL
jgi:hypothetical protein